MLQALHSGRGYSDQVSVDLVLTVPEPYTRDRRALAGFLLARGYLPSLVAYVQAAERADVDLLRWLQDEVREL